MRQPVCPHCDRDLGEGVYEQRMKTAFGKAHVWFCPGCKKVLGTGHRKGFWIG